MASMSWTEKGCGSFSVAPAGIAKLVKRNRAARLHRLGRRQVTARRLTEDLQARVIRRAVAPWLGFEGPI